MDARDSPGQSQAGRVGNRIGFCEGETGEVGGMKVIHVSQDGGLIFYHGCLFFWFSKMQRSVSLSSAEAEYFGAMLAAREVLFIRDLLLAFGIALDGPSVL